MYGDVKVGVENFNPYTSAKDSQAVQQFFKEQLRVTFNGVEHKRLCKPLFCFEPYCCIWSEDLKEVIANGAYEVVKEK